MLSRLQLRNCVRRARRLWREDSGASLLEFTLVVPFLVVFGFGVIEFGNALYQYHLVTAGVRDAGRYLASLGDSDGDGTPDRDAAARTNGKRIAVYGSLTDLTEADKRVRWWSIEDVKVKYCIKGTEEGDDPGPDCPCDDSLGLRGGTNKVCVSTTASYDDVGLLSSYGIGSFTITTGHEERYFETGR